MVYIRAISSCSSLAILHRNKLNLLYVGGLEVHWTCRLCSSNQHSNHQSW